MQVHPSVKNSVNFTFFKNSVNNTYFRLVKLPFISESSSDKMASTPILLWTLLLSSVQAAPHADTTPQLLWTDRIFMLEEDLTVLHVRTNIISVASSILKLPNPSVAGSNKIAEQAAAKSMWSHTKSRLAKSLSKLKVILDVTIQSSNSSWSASPPSVYPRSRRSFLGLATTADIAGLSTRLRVQSKDKLNLAKGLQLQQKHLNELASKTASFIKDESHMLDNLMESNAFLDAEIHFLSRKALADEVTSELDEIYTALRSGSVRFRALGPDTGGRLLAPSMAEDGQLILTMLVFRLKPTSLPVARQASRCAVQIDHDNYSPAPCTPSQAPTTLGYSIVKYDSLRDALNTTQVRDWTCSRSRFELVPPQYTYCRAGLATKGVASPPRESFIAWHTTTESESLSPGDVNAVRSATAEKKLFNWSDADLFDINTLHSDAEEYYHLDTVQWVHLVITCVLAGTVVMLSVLQGRFNAKLNSLQAQMGYQPKRKFNKLERADNTVNESTL